MTKQNLFKKWAKLEMLGTTKLLMLIIFLLIIEKEKRLDFINECSK